METEHPFTLPRGYVDPQGNVHRHGTMRLARAGDEIALLEDPRVRGNRACLVLLLLAKVITRLGDLSGDQITPAVVEGLFSADLAYLESFYVKLNGIDETVTCPSCGRSFSRFLGAT